jgi:GT2 family glycosyltransferase
VLDISISLVSLNQKHDLQRLLPGLFRAIEGLSAEVLLVDNRSSDGTSEWLQEHYPDLDVCHNPNVTGYGGNHNINLGRSKGRYFVVMNSDMSIVSDVFRLLMEFMDANPDIGIVSPMILNEDGTIQGLNKRYPSILDLLLRRFFSSTSIPLIQDRLDYYEMRDIGYSRIGDIPFLSGAFMFCRSELLKAIGGFDANYFLYFEDVDLCRRVQRSHRTVYYPYASVIHFWERSAHKSMRHTRYFLTSALRYFRQWGLRLV